MARSPMPRRRPGAAPLFGAALLACATTGSPAPTATAEDPPLLQLPPAVRPVRYALEIEVDPSADRFQGTATIEVALDAPRRTIWLHARDLRVESATAELGAEPAVPVRLEQVTSEGVARVTLPRTAPAGRAVLRFRWSGAWGDDQVSGLYRIAVGADRYAVTQLEAIYARRVFPCFDEPRFKTPFQVTLTVNETHLAVSNAPVVGEASLGGGRKRVRFADTKPLPTYLVFLGVGPFDVASATIPPSGVRAAPLATRGLAPRGRGGELSFGLALAGDLLVALEQWFGLPYPYEKLDLVAVPSTAWGGMENAGAILFRDSYLLFEEGRSEEDRRRRIANLMAHEISHQWFGNLVTLPWWTDAWLNESFGEFFGARIAHRYRPEWGIDLLQAGWVEEAMRTDGLASARAIRQPLRRTEEISDLFDNLTYDKGQAVLGAFERWMGEERFRRGLGEYLATHAHGTASVDDLLASLSRAAGRDVARPLLGFVEQPGIPLVTVHVACDARGARAELGQRRYRPRGAVAVEAAWQIPVCLRFSAQGSVAENCALVEPEGATVELGPTCPDWLFPDAGGVGYYRWSLSPEDLGRLLASGRAHLEAAERLSLARSVRAARRAGALPFQAAMDALAALAGDPEADVAGAGMDETAAVRELIDPADRAAAEATGRRLYRPALAGRSGFDAPPGETEAARRLRLRAVTFLALVARDPEVRREAARRGADYIGLASGAFRPEAVSPDLAGLALEVAVQEEGAPVFDALLGRLPGIADGPRRRQVLLALSGAEHPALAARAASLWRDSQLTPNERMFLILLREGPGPRRRAFEEVRSHLDEIASVVPATWLSLLPLTADRFCDAERLAEARAVFEPALARHPSMRLNVANVLERIQLCIAEREADAAAATTWLRARAAAAR